MEAKQSTYPKPNGWQGSIFVRIDLATSTSISSGVETTYSASLIKELGFSSPDSAPLNTPCGLVSLASTLVVGYGIRFTSHCWALLAFCCIPDVLRGALLPFATHNRAAQLASIYLVNAITAALMILYKSVDCVECCGTDEESCCSHACAGSFSVGSIIGPQNFQVRDAQGLYSGQDHNFGDAGCGGGGTGSTFRASCVG